MADAIAAVRSHVSHFRAWAERLLLWQIWERLLEVEFVDRSVALAGKAFVSFFPLVIVIASFAPESVRSSIVTSLTSRLGFRGDALVTAQEAFASSDDVRNATGLLGLLFAIFYATSFTTALQRCYLRVWRRPYRSRPGTYWRGFTWLLAMVASLAVLGAIRGALGGGLGFGLFAVIAVMVAICLWWFTAWLMLRGEVRARALLPTGIITGILVGGYGASATVWMPSVLTQDEAQFGMFGVALALVSWFSGAAICVLIGACTGPVLSDDTGVIGNLSRGGADSALKADAQAPLPPPHRELSLRDAFTGTDER
jgi:membrane protein